ncbi:hypothetical protein AVEN_233030-1 [Araneus ventricosus]|uniref:Uncharacterized protein n=1 Tax=Araneus ventricosus TaxID=182803 RepID=A0A4Y2KN65_ARAVE|nr:hypothetical protein AVEN_233030-1 [Araneus ventricosus]
MMNGRETDLEVGGSIGISNTEETVAESSEGSIAKEEFVLEKTSRRRAVKKTVVWKTFKSIVFLICLIFLIIQSVEFFNVYYKYPTTIVTDITVAKEFKLPAITLCFRNTISFKEFCAYEPDQCEKPRNMEEFCSKHRRDCRNGTTNSKWITVLQLRIAATHFHNHILSGHSLVLNNNGTFTIVSVKPNDVRTPSQDRHVKSCTVASLLTGLNGIEDIKRKLSLRDSVGRQSLNVDQPLLLKTIADIAIIRSAADAKRRSESIRSVKTLDDLTAELKKVGFTISRTYLRLLPRNSSTIEGRRHFTTVPVKLSGAQADYHRSHIDSQFAATSKRYLETLASILGPTQVFFLSQNDKARVRLGITAANEQAPILMHMEYRVCLPDHDWVIAERHKLIPSVYAGIVIAPKMPGQSKAVGYSGPTFIAIRSGKHSSSTANAHAQDFETLTL